jgi:hypothetical protein
MAKVKVTPEPTAPWEVLKAFVNDALDFEHIGKHFCAQKFKWKELQCVVNNIMIFVLYRGSR